MPMTWNEHKKTVVHVLMLCILASLLFFWRIGDLDLFGTEARRLLPAREMMESGDLWVPTINGNPYLAKPPLTYWLICVFSMPPDEVTETSARLPSAVCATILILAIYFFVRREQDEEAALLAGIVALTTGLFIEKAIAAEIEMNFAFWVAAGLFLFYRSIEGEDVSFPKIAGAYIFLGLAFLSKGPPALIFFYATVLGFLFLEKRLKVVLSLKHFLALLPFVAICSSWAIMVARGPGWADLSGQREFASRVGTLTELRLGEFLYYPKGIAGAFFPWSLIVPIGFLRSYYNGLDNRRKRLQRFLYCGILTNIVIFSLVAGKSNRYMLPIYPFMIIMAALIWSDLINHSLSGRCERYIRFAFRILFAGGMISLAGVIILNGLYGIPPFPVTLPIYAALAVIAAIGFIVTQMERYKAVAVCLLLCFVCIKLIFVFDYWPDKNRRYSDTEVAERVANHVRPDETIYTVSFNKPRLFYYLHSPVIKLADVPSAIRIAGEDSPTYCLMTDQEIQLLESAYSGPWRSLGPLDTPKER